MKRYAVFTYSQYYPGGGWSDLHGLFDTVEEARSSVTGKEGDFADLVDLVEGEEIDSADLGYDGAVWRSQREGKKPEPKFGPAATWTGPPGQGKTSVIKKTEYDPNELLMITEFHTAAPALHPALLGLITKEEDDNDKE